MNKKTNNATADNVKPRKKQKAARGVATAPPAASIQAAAQALVAVAPAESAAPVVTTASAAEPAPTPTTVPAAEKPTRSAPNQLPKAPAEIRNGVKKPRQGGACRQVWNFLDAHKTATAKEVKEWASSAGLNQNNASIELYNWRKFHGITVQKKRRASVPALLTPQAE